MEINPQELELCSLKTVLAGQIMELHHLNFVAREVRENYVPL